MHYSTNGEERKFHVFNWFIDAAVFNLFSCFLCDTFVFDRNSCSHIEETQRKVSDFLRKKGYKSITEHGENVWKCGVGFLTAMKYIKIEFEGNNTMLISGWVRVICGNEQDLKGAFVCVVPKKQVLDVITELQSCVC